MCGDIVLAMNPYARLPLYTREIRDSVNAMCIFDPDPANAPEPHVYVTAAKAYHDLMTTGRSQSVLVSGESGAGKTETVKILMQHLATVDTDGDDAGDLNPVIRRVIESQPLLEAFGNAKTVRNDNSSRFGKYTQLQFSRAEGGGLMGLEGSVCKVRRARERRAKGSENKRERRKRASQREASAQL